MTDSHAPCMRFAQLSPGTHALHCRASGVYSCLGARRPQWHGQEIFPQQAARSSLRAPRRPLKPRGGDFISEPVNDRNEMAGGACAKVCCAVLCCAVLCCAMLCCAVLCFSHCALCICTLHTRCCAPCVATGCCYSMGAGGRPSTVLGALAPPTPY